MALAGRSVQVVQLTLHDGGRIAVVHAAGASKHLESAVTEFDHPPAPARTRNWKKIGAITGGVFLVLMLIGAVAGDPEEQDVTIQEAADTRQVTTTAAPTTTVAPTTTAAPT